MALTTAQAVIAGCAILGGAVIWSATMLGKDVRCAGYLASSGATEAWRETAMRRASSKAGDRLAPDKEAVLLAPAQMAGCTVRE